MGILRTSSPRNVLRIENLHMCTSMCQHCHKSAHLINFFREMYMLLLAQLYGIYTNDFMDSFLGQIFNSLIAYGWQQIF